MLAAAGASSSDRRGVSTVLIAMQVIDAISSQRQLEKPSVSYGAENLYMHGPLEELTRHNLTKVALP